MASAKKPQQLPNTHSEEISPCSRLVLVVITSISVGETERRRGVQPVKRSSQTERNLRIFAEWAHLFEITAKETFKMLKQAYRDVGRNLPSSFVQVVSRERGEDGEWVGHPPGQPQGLSKMLRT